MSDEELLRTAFGPLQGLPCWGVQRGHGSFLTMEFGEPHLYIREPIVTADDVDEVVRRNLAQRQVIPRGQWHLWIYCCGWSLHIEDQLVGDSSSEESIDRAAAMLSGQRFFEVNRGAGPATWDFRFDLGAVLSTQPYDGSEQWHLYEPDGMVLTALGTGQLERAPGDEPSS